MPGRGVVVRHVGAGVLGANVPAPFQKNSLKQIIYWDGKDDLGFYHKEPQNLRVRVSLGLKPEFDKLLGDGGPKIYPATSVDLPVIGMVFMFFIKAQVHMDMLELRSLTEMETI